MRWIAVAIVLLLTASCAKHDQIITADYNQQAQTHNAQIMDIATKQVENKDAQKTMQLQAFSTALINASKTAGAGDDVGVAMMAGLVLGNDSNKEIFIPTLIQPKQGATSIDYMQAGSVVARQLLLIGGLTGAFDGGFGGEDNDGNSAVSVGGEGNTVFVDSGNAGSYNQAGDDMVLATGQSQDNSTCIDCDNDAGGGVPALPDTSVGGDGDGGGDGSGDGSDLDECLANPPAGYSSAGTPLVEPNCSCVSRANGHC